MAEDLEEDSGEGQAEGEAPPKRNRRRLLLFIAVPILVIILAVVGAYVAGALDFIFKSNKPDAAAPAAAQTQGGDKGAPGAPPGQSTVFYDLPEILVNLNSQAQGRKQNFLKIRVSLELQGPLDVPKVEAVIPRIIDNFQVYLRELRVDDLQGSAGMLRLREELLARVNAAIKPAKVNDVLFKEILVQ